MEREKKIPFSKEMMFIDIIMVYYTEDVKINGHTK